MENPNPCCLLSPDLEKISVFEEDPGEHAFPEDTDCDVSVENPTPKPGVSQDNCDRCSDSSQGAPAWRRSAFQKLFGHTLKEKKSSRSKTEVSQDIVSDTSAATSQDIKSPPTAQHDSDSTEEIDIKSDVPNFSIAVFELSRGYQFIILLEKRLKNWKVVKDFQSKVIKTEDVTPSCNVSPFASSSRCQLVDFVEHLHLLINDQEEGESSSSKRQRSPTMSAKKSPDMKVSLKSIVKKVFARLTAQEQSEMKREIYNIGVQKNLGIMFVKVLEVVIVLVQNASVTGSFEYPLKYLFTMNGHFHKNLSKILSETLAKEDKRTVISPRFRKALVSTVVEGVCITLRKTSIEKAALLLKTRTIPTKMSLSYRLLMFFISCCMILPDEID